MKEVRLKIKGIQISSDGEENTIELITEGKFYEKNGAYYLVYDESEISGMEGSTTTLKIQGDRLSMKRFGNNSSKLIFEKGKKFRSEYLTAHGDFDMEVLTSKLDIDLSDLGIGSIDVAYRLNITNVMQSRNQLTIDVM